MNVKNCRSCGRLFNYIGGIDICPACKEKSEQQFQVVKKYIREHPGASMQEVSDECDVELQKIKQWLRDDRLELAEGSAIMLDCESCGAPIRSGRLCDKCRFNTIAGFNELTQKKAPQQPQINRQRENDRMRFLDR